MNKNLRISLTSLAAATIVLLAGLGNPASAQYVISARAGLVNYTTGPVSYSRSSDPTWREIPSHLQLQEGDRLKTESWGKAELLLNPGTYLRIGGSAEVVVLSTDLTATAVELRSGSAIVEVGQVPDEATITVQTPFSRVQIKKDGVYRIDLASDAMTLTVRHGEAYFLQSDGKFKKVKKNKTVLITAHDSQIARFDSSFADEFDLWSADRAELLLAANQSFVRRMGSWSWPSLYWNAWVYDPFFGCYTFFPWRSGFWSPYGFGYYYPWYPSGNWSGGGSFPLGRGDAPRGGAPPSTPHKPGLVDKPVEAGQIGLRYGGRTTAGKAHTSAGGFSNPGSIGSPKGSLGAGSSGGRVGGAPTGHMGGGGKVGEKK